LTVILLGSAVWMTAGCGKRQLNAADKPAIDDLLTYEPKYEMDNQGRVFDLKLEGPRVDDRALPHLKALGELRRLSLYGSGVTDAGLAALKDSSKLESLGLGGTAVTDAGLVHLEKMPGLQYLWLSKGEKLTSKGVEKLKKALPGLTVYLQ
jgi:hypothetical protein